MTNITTAYALIQEDMDEIVNSGNQLLWEDKFPSSFSFTYSFLNPGTYGMPDYYGTNSNEIDITGDFTSYTALDGAEQSIVTAVLQTLAGTHYRVSFSDIVDNMSFTSVTHDGAGVDDSGDITFGKATDLGDVYGFEYSREDASDGTNTADKSGIVFDAADLDSFEVINNAGWATWLVLHEMGHSLGLDHTAEVYGLLNTHLDNMKYSVMSLIPVHGVAPENLQLLDIAALQEKYGSRDYDTRNGTTTYALDQGLGTSAAGVYDGDFFLYTIWDGGGDDTIDVSGYDDVVSAEIDLRQGRFSSIGEYPSNNPVERDADWSPSDPDPGNVAIAYYTIIENAIGTGLGDTIIGNAWDNILEGGDGNDTLYGDGWGYDRQYEFMGWEEEGNDPDHAADLSGDDSLFGDAGNDILFGGRGTDILDGGADSDTADYSVYRGYTKITFTDTGEGYVDKYLGQADDSGSADNQDSFFSIEKIVFGSLGGLIVGETTADDLVTEGSGEINTGDGDDTVTVGGVGAVVDTGDGDDTIHIKNGATNVHIRNDGDSATDDQVILEGTDPDDVTFVQMGDDLWVLVNGSVVFVLEDHFGTGGTGVDDVIIDDGVSPVTVDVTDLTSADLVRLNLFDIPNWLFNYQVFFNVDISNVWDPLVIDLDSDGIEGVARSTGPQFDLDGNGLAEETGWLDGDDGFLARDINDNGRIDNGTEMFGNATTHGFAALAAFDSNTDGVINASDTAIWGDLIVWRDLNSDNNTQSDELFTLASLNITGINLTNLTTPNTVVFGAGVVSHAGTVTTTTGTLTAGNLNFTTDTTNQRYTADYDFDARAAFLPNIRGYNDMPELSIALSLDNDEENPDSLMALMLSTVSRDFTDFFENYDDVRNDLRDAMFRWAGVDDVNPTSRGAYIDAREIEFIEAVLGQGFVDGNFTSGNPGAVQGREIHDLFEDLFSQYAGGIWVQTFAATLFEEGLYYDFESDLVHGTLELSQDGLDALEAHAAGLSTTQERLDFWVNVTTFIVDIHNGGVGGGQYGLSSEDETLLSAAIEASDEDLTWYVEGHNPGGGVTAIEYRYLNPVGETFTGTSGANNLTGSFEADTMIGLAGADSLYGNDGNDVIYGHNEDGSGDDGAADWLDGQNGDDYLVGGAGNDTLIGGLGNDHLVGGDGDDILRDGGGTGATNIQNLLEGGAGNDMYIPQVGALNAGRIYIVDPEGWDPVDFGGFQYTLANLTFTRLLNDHIQITAARSNTITTFTIDNMLTDLSNPNGVGIEAVKLYSFIGFSAPGSWFDIKAHLRNWTGSMATIGTQSDDTIYGITFGNKVDNIRTFAGHDTIYAGEGNDTVDGEVGRDYIDGGTGDDNLEGGDDDDTIYGGDGADWLKGERDNDQLYGGDGNDTIWGDVGNDILSGGDGNDSMIASSGNDTLDGGAGNDTLDGSDGNDTYIFSAGTDLYRDYLGTDTLQITSGILPENLAFSRSGANVIITASGPASGETTVENQWNSPNYRIDSIAFEDGFTLNFFEYSSSWSFDANTASGSDETITATGGGKIVIARGGTDRIYGTNGGIDNLSGGADNDFIYAGAGNDLLHGGSGNDELYGQADNDQLWGSTGNDLLAGGAGNDVMNGGDGTDTASYSASVSAITISLVTGSATGEGTDTLSSIENVIGSSSDDTITGSSGDNIIRGGAGNDTLQGGAGSDTYIFNTGDGTADAITDTSGTMDYIDLLAAGIDPDEVTFTVNSNDLNVDFGADDFDIIGQLNGSDTKQIERIRFADGTDLSLIQYAAWNFGTSSGDTINGTSGNNFIWGGAGNDTITGHASGNDDLAGGAGNDWIDGRDGADFLTGGDGDDDLFGQNGNDILYGNAGDDHLTGDSGGNTGNDVLYGGAGEDVLGGDSGNDILYGDADDDVLNGGTGNDTLYGGDGDDNLLAGEGSNTLYGENGNDRLTANSGVTGANDYLAGGDGDDTYFFLGLNGGIDTVYDSGGTNDVVAAVTTKSLQNILFQQVGNNLEIISASDSTNKVIIQDHFKSANAIEQLAVSQIVMSLSSFNSWVFLNDSGQTATGGSGVDTVIGGAGNDTLNGNGGADELYGAEGTDSITGGDGDDWLQGASGDDIIDGGNDDDHITGDDSASAELDPGDDQLTGGAGEDTIVGQAGNDIIEGGLGDDVLNGGGDNDSYLYDLGDGEDTIFDTSGTSDTIIFAAGINPQDLIFADVTDEFGQLNLEITFDGAAETDKIILLDHNDGGQTHQIEFVQFDGGHTLSLIDHDEWQFGTSSGETLNGDSGTDIIAGDAGNDTLNGDAGADWLSGDDGDDTVNGGDGNDTIVGGSGAGNDTYNGGNDTDVVVYTSTTAGVTVDLSAGSNQATGSEIGTDQLSNIENVTGGSGNDTITGDSNANVLKGEAGNDTLKGGAGNDTLDGGSGTDTADYSAAGSAVTVNLATGSATGEGADTLSNIENVTGSANNDTITGSSVANTLNSGDGNDTVKGAGGADTLDGGSGTDTVDYSSAAAGVTVSLASGTASNDGDGASDTLSNFENVTGSGFADTITGSTGANVLTGGAGNDILTGGTGDDTIDGGADTDTVSYTGAGAVTVNLGTGSATGDGTDTLSNIENVTGSANADTITGNSGTNILKGVGGADTLDGGDGTDTVDYSSAASGVTVSLASGTASNDGDGASDTLSNFENVTGSADADTITGNSGANVLTGGAGNDILTGGAGDDTLDGGADTDTVSYTGAGAVTVNVGTGSATGDGTDTLSNIENVIGSANADTITGSSGANIISGAGGADTLDGGDGTDTVDYSAAAAGVTVSLASGTASNDGDGASDTLSNFENVTGSSNADTITGNSGANILNGGDGNDTIDGGLGDDTIDGGAGTDTVSYALAGGINVSLATGTGTSTSDGTDTLSNIENVTGSATDDIIAGNSSANTLNGGDGIDYISGSGGNDTLDGGAGTDFLDYSAAAAGVTVSLASGTASNDGDGGSDTLSNLENVIGSGFADTITGSSTANIISGGAGNDTLDGGSDTDTVDYSSSSSAVTVNLSTGSATGDGTDTLSNFENVNGSSYADTITGSSGANVLSGGEGNDTIKGGAGNDAIDGGDDTDTVDYSAAAAGVTVSLASGTASNDGDSGSDTLGNIENVTGSANADTLTGDTGDNTLKGGAGNDTLDGGAGTDTADYSSAASAVTVNLSTGSATGGDGTDTLSNIENVTGSAYNDTITGSSGNNTIIGGAGNDTVSTGDGNDLFIYSSGLDSVDGGNGTDTADFSGYGYAVKLDLTHASEEAETSGTSNWNTGGGFTNLSHLANIENLTGSAYQDKLVGNTGANVLTGGAEDDILQGGTGADEYVYNAGDGDDTITETTGTDVDIIRFGAGITQAMVNLAYVSPAGYQDLMITFDGAGTDSIMVLDHNNISASKAVEKLVFSDSSEILLRKTETGTSGDDVLTGAFGMDTLSGGDGNDTINGGEGHDTINGDGGNDTIVYGDTTIYTTAAFIDSFDGGTGTDTADFSGYAYAVKLDLTDATQEAETTHASSWNSGTLYYLAHMANIENLIGTAYKDKLVGDTGANVLTGGAEDDILQGGTGADEYVYNAGDGDDTITETTGTDVDIIRFGAGITQDIVNIALDSGGSYQDLIITFDGAATDSITITDHNKISAPLPVEKLVFADASEILLRKTETGTAGADIMTGAIGMDTLSGGDGDDTLNGGEGHDTINGDGGNDTIVYGDTYTYTASAYIDSFDGGTGTDTADFSGYAYAVKLDLTDATQEAETTHASAWNSGTLYYLAHMANIENLTGTAYHDKLVGDSNANVLSGLAGNDILDGGNGTDTASYSSASSAVVVNLGTGTATGGAGSDTISNIENVTGSANADTITGSTGDNVIEGLNGNDTLDGGSGTDTVSYGSAGSAVTVNLAAGTASGGAGTDALSNFENVTGSAHNDTLTGSTASNTLSGGDGNDTIIGGAGNDTLDGGNGTDTADYSADGAGVTVNLGTGTATDGNSDTDTLSGIENATGSAYADTITGSSSANTLHGGSGNDHLIGGDGADVLYGDGGADTFVFENATAFNNIDQILDFTSGGGGDILDLSDILTGYDSGSHQLEDFLQLATNGSDTTISVDVDGATGGTSWTQIGLIVGVTGLTDEDALVTSGNLIV